MTQQRELKPCPFCDTKLILDDSSNFLGNALWRVNCENGECVMNKWDYKTQDEAIKAANTRATSDHTEVLKMAMDALNRMKRPHNYCEDSFYSCPKASEGCSDPRYENSDECNCGADEANSIADKVLAAIDAALGEQKEE